MIKMSDYILELKGITKIFPGVKALDNVHFQLKEGEIHALMGENGAGKSTFIKVITGVHQPEEGEIFINGEKVDIKNPKDAQKLSIAAIYQHGTTYQYLSVTENIFIGHEKMTKLNTIDWKQMHKDAKALLERLGSNIDPHSSMGNLTVAEQQIVEIAKAISTNAKIIIMDEPTAALSKRECEELYRITEQLRDEGCSIIFISHRFEDMYRLASRVTVFRDSQYIGTWDVDGISNDLLISKMVGREISQIYPKQQLEKGEEIFKVEGLSKTGYYKDVSFSLHKGEILAMTGLVGAGRTEVCQGIMGIERPDSGKVILEGKTLKIKHPSDAMNAGIGYLPEDRQKQGLILDWGLGQNVTLATLEKFTKNSIINRKQERQTAKVLLEKVKTKALSVYDKASSLSGGNQQKVIVAKVLNSDLKVVILDEPTKGVDVGAKAQIYEIMSDLAAQGFGVIMISSEMPEVLGMADTILVMKEGRVSKIFDEVKGVTQEQILESAMNM
jgi:rhamnose transport system ATP-binding protein